MPTHPIATKARATDPRFQSKFSNAEVGQANTNQPETINKQLPSISELRKSSRHNDATPMIHARKIMVRGLL
ncbi:hypothetical protein HY29_18005 [Hyphomonas beringensis]|uniref:Uncharacterized protein n=1 Tax=Hyphomonas beringensis TaxID=1280946 RepID=A0A062U893_9PROT|nr:hypothetical protein HY29_18005 [Hyphomonas beringensis]